MMHKTFPEVNDMFYLWRDDAGVLHTSRENHRDARTHCELATDYLRYAGRLEAPTCLRCVTTV